MSNFSSGPVSNDFSLLGPRKSASVSIDSIAPQEPEDPRKRYQQINSIFTAVPIDVMNNGDAGAYMS